MPIVDTYKCLLMYTKYSLPIFSKIFTRTIVIDKGVDDNCRPQIFFGPWRKFISINNYADVNICIKAHG